MPPESANLVRATLEPKRNKSMVEMLKGNMCPDDIGKLTKIRVILTARRIAEIKSANKH